MPRQKDLKRLVRTRMRKTGEAYTAARAQILRNPERRHGRVQRATSRRPFRLTNTQPWPD